MFEIPETIKTFFKKQYIEENTSGTYAAIKYDKQTEDKIKQFIEKYQIPNGNGKELHTTLLYSSRYLPNYEPLGSDVNYGKIKFKQFKKFDDSLVIILDAPLIVERHNELMKKHNAIYDYGVFIPHITLSYNAPDVDLNSLDGTYFTFNDFTFSASEEYSEDLDINKYC